MRRRMQLAAAMAAVIATSSLVAHAQYIQDIPPMDGWSPAVVGCDACVVTEDGYLSCASQAEWETCAAGICAGICPTDENGYAACESEEAAAFCGYQ